MPTAAELVEAVREFLEGDVLAATEGRVRFHARVATNVLAMVERELVLGPAQAEAHADRLPVLGFADDAGAGRRHPPRRPRRPLGRGQERGVGHRGRQAGGGQPAYADDDGTPPSRRRLAA